MLFHFIYLLTYWFIIILYILFRVIREVTGNFYYEVEVLEYEVDGFEYEVDDFYYEVEVLEYEVEVLEYEVDDFYYEVEVFEYEVEMSEYEVIIEKRYYNIRCKKRKAAPVSKHMKRILIVYLKTEGC